MNWFNKVFLSAWIVLGILSVIGLFVSSQLLAIFTNIFTVVNMPVLVAMILVLVANFKNEKKNG